MESENKQVNQKQVLGEKKKSWWRTGLKIGGSILGATALGLLGSKMSGGNNVPIQTGGGSGNQLIDGVLQQQGRIPPRIEVSQSDDFSAVVWKKNILIKYIYYGKKTKVSKTKTKTISSC